MFLFVFCLIAQQIMICKQPKKFPNYGFCVNYFEDRNILYVLCYIPFQTFILYVTYSFMYRGLTNLFDAEGNLIVTVNSSVYFVNGRRILDPNNPETQLTYPILRRLLIEQRRQAAAARSASHEP
jgi:hypothetical protein